MDPTFTELYRAHYPAILRFVRRRAREADVDDVVSETFLAAWQRQEQMTAAPLPWLYRTARNVLLSLNSITKAQLDAWMAAPPDPSAIGKAASACLKGSKGAADPQISAVDQRGSVLTLLARDPVSQEVWWCFDTPAGIAAAASVFGGTGIPLPKPAAAGTVDLLSGGGAASPGYSLGYAYGQAGPGVSSVTFAPHSGEKVTASVKHGYWNVWWTQPASDLFDMGNGTLTWTTANGTSHTASQKSIMASTAK